MDVCADDFGYPSCEEVPDDDATVVAAHSQQGSPAVEGAREGHADTVQSAICLLSSKQTLTNNSKKNLKSIHKALNLTALKIRRFNYTHIVVSMIFRAKNKIGLCVLKTGGLPLDSSAQTILREEQKERLITMTWQLEQKLLLVII